MIIPDTELSDTNTCSIWPELQAEVVAHLPLRLSMLTTGEAVMGQDAEGEKAWKLLDLSECSTLLSIVGLAAP